MEEVNELALAYEQGVRDGAAGIAREVNPYEGVTLPRHKVHVGQIIDSKEMLDDMPDGTVFKWAPRSHGASGQRTYRFTVYTDEGGVRKYRQTPGSRTMRLASLRVDSQLVIDALP